MKIIVFILLSITCYSQNSYILVDYTKPSNKYRFFVYHDNKIVDKFLVCSGITDKNNKVEYSNIVNSNRSSKGDCRIGASYWGTFGKAYKLYGLNTTNSNVFARFIVLHGHSCVPEKEQSYPICNSQGCYTLNPKAFIKVDNYISKYNIKIIKQKH
jgi:hypothetical protein